MNCRLSLHPSFFCAAPIAALFFGLVIPNQPNPVWQELKKPIQKDHTPMLMRAKLSSSQRLMEGLVTEDFSLVEKGANELRRISQASHWPQTQDRVYSS